LTWGLIKYHIEQFDVCAGNYAVDAGLPENRKSLQINRKSPQITANQHNVILPENRKSPQIQSHLKCVATLPCEMSAS